MSNHLLSWNKLYSNSQSFKYPSSMVPYFWFYSSDSQVPIQVSLSLSLSLSQ